MELIKKIYQAVRDTIRDHRAQKQANKDWPKRRCQSCGKGFATDTHIYMSDGDYHRECWYNRPVRSRILAEDMEFSDKHTE